MASPPTTDQGATPDGRATGPPDYVGVGGLGLGARWWHDLLLQHPAVERRDRADRELHFFDTFCTRPMTVEDVASYHARFPRSAGRIAGEWTPRYMYDPWTPLLLARAAPDARLLVVLSDPVELYRSAPCRSDAAGRPRYGTQLRGLTAHYDRERILVLQYERCRKDPLGEYARTLRFLGLDDGFRPRLVGNRLGSLARSASEVLLRARRLVRPVRRPEEPIRLWPELERSLVVALEPEVAELRTHVPDLDLRLWPRFAHLAA